jgi:hypothetical protein
VARIQLIIDHPINIYRRYLIETDQVEKLKQRIQKENRHNSSKRRRFSTRLRSDIIKFSEIEKLSSYSCSKLLGIGNTTLDKWKSIFFFATISLFAGFNNNIKHPGRAPERKLVTKVN